MKRVDLDRVRMIDVRIPIPGFEDFMAAYLVEDADRGRTILFETGPAASAPALLKDLDALGADRVDWLVFTHIHLDHSGGAGEFLAAHPETRIICNRRARRHLVDPSRLWEGSLAVLGDVARAYREPKPIAPEAIAPDGFALEGLEEYETPGHAPHHSSFAYEFADGTRVLFAGEAAGVCFAGEREPSHRPASPVGFRFADSVKSLELLTRVPADYIAFPHYGIFDEPGKILARAKAQLSTWRAICEEMSGSSPSEIAAALNERDPLIGRADGASAERELAFTLQSLSGFLHDMRTKA